MCTALLPFVMLSGALAQSWEPDPRAQRALEKAEKARADDRLDKAARQLDKLLRREPVPGQVLLARARVALDQADPPTAHPLLERCSAAFPERWDCAALQAELLASEGRLEEAGPIASDAWARGCALPQVQALVGWQLGQTEGPAALATWLEEQEAPFAARPCLQSTVSVARGVVARATVALHRCRQTRSPLRPSAAEAFAQSGVPVREADAVADAAQPADLEAYRQALAALEAGSTEAAAQALDALVLRYPLDPELRLRAAEADRRLGFVDQAQVELGAAAAMDPLVVAGEHPPTGVLLPLSPDAAGSLIAGAATVLVELLLEEDELASARAVLERASAHLGDTAALEPVRRRLSETTSLP